MKSIILLGNFLSFIAALVVVSPATAAPPSIPSPRQHFRLDDNWRFLRLPDSAAAPQGAEIGGWRTKPAPGVTSLDGDKALPADIDAGDWRPIKVGDDAFDMKPGFAWFQAGLGDAPAPKPGERRIIQFMGFDDDVAVWVNGVYLASQTGYNTPLEVDITRLWHPGGPNSVTALVQNDQGAGGVSSPAYLQTVPLHPGPALVPAEARAGYDDHFWRTVHLPHDYIVEGVFTPTADSGHGSLPMPPAWYRKVFALPADDRGKSLSLRFDGVYRDSKVYLNGVFLGEHQSGYTGFRYDISRAARYGQANTLAVHVDPSRDEGWFYEGGGIYRHVWLDVTNPIHIADHGVYVTTSLPEPNYTGKAASAQVIVQTSVANQSDTPARVNLTAVVTDQTDHYVADTLSPTIVLPPGRASTVTQTLTVLHPQLWWLDAPHLYHATVTVIRQGRAPEQYTTPDQDTATFGIRTLRFDPDKGFFLNGRRTEIQGTCNHQDFAGVGIAIPDSLLYWRVAKLKAMGCNAYRCSHNPVTPALLDACDRLGMLVMDENRHLGDTYGAKANNGTQVGDLSDLREMILNDRNHPSIIMWSLCNEEFALQGTPKGAQLFAAMKRFSRRYDDTRPYTCAMNGDAGQGISNVEDLQGFNYNIGSYDGFHAAHPSQPCFGSETSSDVGTRGEYADNTAKGYVTAYDTENAAVNWGQSAENAWQPIAARPWMEGGFVWTGFDYKGEPTPYGWPDINSNFGIMDEAGIPKDNYYYYQSVWSDKPVAHIVPSNWNLAGQEGKIIPVWVYSNAESVELFLNGHSLGVRPMPRYGHAEWQVPYAPGTLRAVGTTSWSQIASDEVQTTGAPASLRLTLDSDAPRSLHADGEEALVVDASVVDAKGRVVPDAGDELRFQASGAAKIAGTGNGDPSDHEPDRGTSRAAYHGRCIAVVQAGDRPGTVTITATAPGLTPASVSFPVLAGE